MKTCRIFKTGRSPAVRIPKAWIGNAAEVEMTRRGKDIVIRPKTSTLWQVAEENAALGPDFPDRLKQTHTGVRARI
jgi:virulence-associated protein VagC